MTIQFAIGTIGYAAAVNLLAYAAMVIDKSRAESGRTRIPETTLLNLAVIGGSLGTVIAQQMIRHKTRKEPFRSRLGMIVLLQILAMIAFVAGLVATGSPTALLQVLLS